METDNSIGKAWGGARVGWGAGGQTGRKWETFVLLSIKYIFKSGGGATIVPITLGGLNQFVYIYTNYLQYCLHRI